MRVLILNLRLRFSRKPVDLRFWMSCRISNRGVERKVDPVISRKAPMIRTRQRLSPAVSRAPPA